MRTISNSVTGIPQAPGSTLLHGPRILGPNTRQLAQVLSWPSLSKAPGKPLRNELFSARRKRVSSDSLGDSSRGHQCGHGDSSQIAGQGKAGPIRGSGCSARAHAGHYAPNADPEGHDQSSQQAHDGTLPRDTAHSLVSMPAPPKLHVSSQQSRREPCQVIPQVHPRT